LRATLKNFLEVREHCKQALRNTTVFPVGDAFGLHWIQLIYDRGMKQTPQKRENPVISDWVRISGGSTEGLLGGWLAQRQAALREVMAAGHIEPLHWSSVRAGST